MGRPRSAVTRQAVPGRDADPRPAPSGPATRAHPHLTFKVLGIPEAVPEYRFDPKRRWHFDFSWPELRLALEVEGGAWQYGRHNRASGFIKDLEKYSEAAIQGWRVIRVTPDQLADGTAASMVNRAILNGRFG